MTAADPTAPEAANSRGDDDGTILIGVVVSQWEQACCGMGFRVGDVVTWDVFWARDGILTDFGPDQAEGVDLAETHHGGLDVGALTRVAGRVVAIRAVSQRIHRPDPAGPSTTVRGESTSTPVDQVHGRARSEPGDAAVAVSAAAPAPGSQRSAPAPAPVPRRPARTSPPDPSDPRVFIPPTGDWYAVAGEKVAPERPDEERSHLAGWIVELDVPAGTALPDPDPAPDPAQDPDPAPAPAPAES